MQDPTEAQDAVRALNETVRDRWNQNAGFWDDYMGPDGNRFHRELVAPAAARLLAAQPGETILEIACGAGLFARQLAIAGARVVAIDSSEAFLERARARTLDCADRVELLAVDATDEEQLLALGEGRFDGAVSNMALMDMAAIEPLFRALRSLLKPGGRFVFTVTHPCFNNTGCARMVEETDTEGDIAVTHAVKVWRYLSVRPARGIGVRGQPIAQYYFDRPISVLLAAAFGAGFVLDGLEEPAFSGPDADRRSLSMSNFTEIPFVLAVRLRLPAQ